MRVWPTITYQRKSRKSRRGENTPASQLSSNQDKLQIITSHDLHHQQREDARLYSNSKLSARVQTPSYLFRGLPQLIMNHQA
jgi:hypothetical protein